MPISIRPRWRRCVSAAVVAGLVAVLLSPAVPASGISAQTVADVEERDSLIASQENLLNTYRCLFGVDVGVVPGGCPNPDLVSPAIAPQSPTQRDVGVRDQLIASQEALLNIYRCLFGADIQIVPGGCVNGEPAAAPPAGWYLDPTCRNEYRRWDGTEWADRARTGKAFRSDPLRAGESPTWPSNATGCGVVGDCGEETEMFPFDADADGFSDGCERERRAPFTGILGYGLTAEWSPDGTRILIDGSGELNVVNADGTGANKIADFQDRLSGASWSPDGTRVLYIDEGLWAIGADGSKRRKLADSHQSADRFTYPFARWSPDGTRVLYFTGGQNDGELWVIDADGVRRRKIAGGQLPAEFVTYDLWAQWSPDGSHIAYHDFSSGDYTSGRGGLFAAGADGSSPALIAGTGHHGTAFSWSPDGSALAYNSRGFWTAAPDGTNRRKISDWFLYAHECEGWTRGRWGVGGMPVWSPDGARIAVSTPTLGFSSQGRRDVILGGVFVMDADGGDQRRLATHYEETGIAWSPDGASIAFRSSPPTEFAEDGVVCGAPLDAGTYVLGADGTGLRKIADEHRPRWPSGASSSSWSPDGDRVLVSTPSFDEDNQISVIAGADGSPVADFTGERFYGAAWSPDGRRVVALANRGAGPGAEVWLLDAAPGPTAEPPSPRGQR